jgi:hypothetical protein
MVTAAFRAVLFDFAGTLFAPENETAWVRAVLDRRGVRLGRSLAGTLTPLAEHPGQ